MNRFAPGLVTGLILGAVLALAFGPLLLPDPQRDTVIELRTDAPRPQASPEPPPAELSAAAPTERQVETHRSGGESALAGLLASLNCPPVERGDGTIHGSITTLDGSPLAGVRVRATPLGGPRRFAPGEADLEERVNTFARAEVWRHRARRESTSDAVGDFVLNGLTENEICSLSCFKAGFQFSSVSGGGMREVRPGATMKLLAKPVVVLDLDLRRPDGRRPQRATVHLVQGPARNNNTWYPESRTITTAPGHYVLTASADSETLRAGPIEVDLTSAPQSLRLDLEPVPMIRGWVITPEDERPDHFIVRLIALRPGEKANHEQLQIRGERVWAHERSSYSFHFADLSPGSYALAAFHNDGQPASDIAVVELSNSAQKIELIAYVANRADYVAVWVRGPDGAPIPDAAVSAHAGDRQTGYSSRSGSATTKSDGSIWIEHAQARGSGEGARYFVQVRCHLGEKRADYERSEHSEVHVHFAEPASLKVSLTGHADESLLGRLQLNLVPGAGANRRFGPRVPRTDNRRERGPVRIFAKIQPGDYTLQLSLQRQESMPRISRLATCPVQIAPGKNLATMPVPALHQVVVATPEGTTGSSIILGSKDPVLGLHRQAHIGEQCRATLDDVPPGRYTLMIHRGDGNLQSMEIAVPTAGVIRFQPVPHNALAVKVYGARGYLARAGLRSGDLLVGIAGQAFQDDRQMQAALIAAAQKDRALFDVKRGGATLQIELDPRRIAMRTDLGGAIQPTCH